MGCFICTEAIQAWVRDRMCNVDIRLSGRVKIGWKGSGGEMGKSGVMLGSAWGAWKERIKSRDGEIEM
jgi:hypothetical protein